MKRVAGGSLILIAVLSAVHVIGCRRSAHLLNGGASPATHPTTQAAIFPPVEYHNQKFGVSLSYPSNWKPTPSADYQLLIVPKQDEPPCTVAFDVPDLPTHLPGFIPIGMVYDGYLSDLKKQCSDVQANVTTPTIPGAHARLANCTGERDGKKFVEHALLLVHGDHVYIVRAYGSPEADTFLNPVFNSMCKSLQWK
jgi:hypothetical protein